MSTNKNTNLFYTLFKELDCYDAHIKTYAPPVNIEHKYIIEYKVPEIDVLYESPLEFVSILIQLTNDGYNILNVYYRGRNHKAKKYVDTFRILLDKVVSQI